MPSEPPLINEPLLGFEFGAELIDGIHQSEARAVGFPWSFTCHNYRRILRTHPRVKPERVAFDIIPFEMNVGSQSLISLLDVKLANELGKAARVLLDEGEIVGLAARVTTEANRKVTVNGQRQHISQSTRLSVAGGEAPPR